MSKLIVVSTTSVLALCCVRQEQIGQTLSMYNIIYSQDVLTTFGSIKERLRSGEMAVCGDQWPMFLYDGYSYDPEDPWNGLFRSALLVSVSFAITRFCQWAQ